MLLMFVSVCVCVCVYASFCAKHDGMVAHDTAQNKLTEAVMALAYELINFGYAPMSSMSEIMRESE
jgi:hypothetical protein